MASTQPMPLVALVPEAQVKDVVEDPSPTLDSASEASPAAPDPEHDAAPIHTTRTASLPPATLGAEDQKNEEHHAPTGAAASEEDASSSDGSALSFDSNKDRRPVRRRRRASPRGGYQPSEMDDYRPAYDRYSDYRRSNVIQPGAARGAFEPLADYIKRTWICEISQGSMQDWRKRKWNALKWPHPIIDAFYLNKPLASSKSEDADSAADSSARQVNTSKALGELRNLQRICIMSEYLQQEIASFSPVPLGFGRDTINIGPPYKVLVRSFRDLEARLLELKAKADVANAKKTSDVENTHEPSLGSRSDARNRSIHGELVVSRAYGRPRRRADAQKGSRSDDEVAVDSDDREEASDLLNIRYTHLKVLVDFVKQELGDVLQLRDEIADGTLRSIHFEDLWHLFEPGEVVYRHTAEEDPEGLFNVYFVSGGQSLKRSQTLTELNEINMLRDKMRYFKPPTGIEEKEVEDLVEELLREEGSSIGTWTPFKIDSYYMVSDGDRCGPMELCHRIWPFEGRRDITSLKVYPLRFHPNKDNLLISMIQRGRKYLFNEGHKSYEGRTYMLRRNDVSQVEIKGDVYIDASAYFHDFPHAKPRLGRILRSKQIMAEVEEGLAGNDTSAPKGYNNPQPYGMNPFAPQSEQFLKLSGHELDTKLSDEYLTFNSLRLEPFTPKETEIDDKHLCLMPPACQGYSFHLRKWFPLHLDLVNDIDRESEKARREGFDDLVIPKSYRDLLVALVDSHGTGPQRRQGTNKTHSKAPLLTQIDLVRGKGQGLIILLHGPPGSGKTSTAETIAAYTRRPLYSITCGDIGTDPMVVEAKLLEHMQRADKWGCVLLLDEADVFLVQRDWYNLQRNALTSIFLRQLEYYAGILFLTTNRPGVIDEAFKSRVHISLRYPGVGLDSTKKQWTNILNRLEADNETSDVKIVFDRDALLEFAERHFEKCDRQGVTWNGRQIRNAFQTAIALGHYERISKIREAGMTPEEALKTGKKKWRTVKLTKANFANIAKTAREFEQYIETLRGSDSQNARESELRYDDYDPERPRARKQYPGMEGARDRVRELQENVRGGKGIPVKGKAKKGVRVEMPKVPDDDEEEEEEEDDDDDDDDEDEDENNDDF